MSIINLTPHPINIYRMDSDLVLASIPPSGNVARLVEADGGHAASIWIDRSHAVDWDDTENYVLAVPAIERTWGEIHGLPEPDGSLYVVAMPVLSALAARGELRRDVCCVDSAAGAVRNDSGTIIGTRRLIFLEAPKLDERRWVRWYGTRAEADERLKEENGHRWPDGPE